MCQNFACQISRRFHIHLNAEAAPGLVELQYSEHSEVRTKPRKVYEIAPQPYAVHLSAFSFLGMHFCQMSPCTAQTTCRLFPVPPSGVFPMDVSCIIGGNQTPNRKRRRERQRQGQRQRCRNCPTSTFPSRDAKAKGVIWVRGRCCDGLTLQVERSFRSMF